MQTDRAKARFRGFFQDYAEEHHKGAFDTLKEQERSRLMARFFAHKVIAPQNPTSIPATDEDLDYSMVDGSGDCNVDFICRESGIVTIIQAKYSSPRKASKRRSEEPSDFEAFRNVLQKLHDYREVTMNARLREFAADIDWDLDHFRLYYITLRELTIDQKSTPEWTIAPLPGIHDICDRADIQIFDEEKLNIELRDALSIGRGTPTRVELLFTPNADSKPYIRIGQKDGRGCYVGRVSAAQLAELMTRHRSSLFSLNIRNYIGDTATNKQIRRTAIEDSDNFFFFNNGISALADEIESSNVDERVLVCRNLSIVNGAQTVRSLQKAHTSKGGHQASDAQVLVRLTESHSKKTTAEQEFLDSLTKYNNTQNAIKVSDFRSNDKIQHDLRSQFANLPSLSGKKFAYKNKRSGPNESVSGRSGDISIGMEEFTKTVYAFLFGPADVFGGTSHLFDASKGGGYVKLFGDEYGDLLPAMTKDLFGYYAGVWFLCTEVKDIWREEVGKRKHPGLERQWMFYFAVGRVLEQCYDSDCDRLKQSLRRLSNPQWLSNRPDGEVHVVIRKLADIAIQALTQCYDRQANLPGFTHRNWFRSEATLTTVKTECENLSALLRKLGAACLLP